MFATEALGGTRRGGRGGERVGEESEMFDDFRGKALEERDELAADPDAREARVEVARVLGVADRMAAEVLEDVGPARPEERADQRRAALGSGFISERRRICDVGGFRIGARRRGEGGS